MTSSDESGSEAAPAPQRIWNILERTTDRLHRMAEQNAVRARESAAFEELMKERMKEEREESARQRKEAARQREEAAHRSRDLDRRMKETDRQVKETARQMKRPAGR